MVEFPYKHHENTVLGGVLRKGGYGVHHENTEYSVVYFEKVELKLRNCV